MSTPETKPSTGRRGLLKGAAASALATSAVVFGNPGQAQAHYNHYGCCHLYYQPGSWGTCINGDYYIWSCYTSDRTRYQCCERWGPGQGWYVYSAYRIYG